MSVVEKSTQKGKWLRFAKIFALPFVVVILYFVIPQMIGLKPLHGYFAMEAVELIVISLLIGIFAFLFLFSYIRLKFFRS